MARGRAALFLLSLSAILFEISLTRLASVLVHTTLTFVVIAACLAALGLGAAFAGRRLDDETLPLRAALVASLGGALAVATVVATPLGFALGLFAIPFLGLGAFAARVYARLPSPRFTYAADALGGAAGAALAPLAIRSLGDVNAALAATAIAAAAGWLVAPAAGQRLRLALLLAPVAFAGNLALPTLEVDPWTTWGFRPHMVAQAKDRAGRVLETRYDAFGRTDLVATDEPWMRYLFTDRMYTARIARWDGLGERFADAPLEELSRLKGLAFRALHPARVLVLGTGGGFDVALALQSGARQIEAVEINGAMLAMTRALADFSGRIFDRPEVAGLRGRGASFRARHGRSLRPRQSLTGADRSRGRSRQHGLPELGLHRRGRGPVPRPSRLRRRHRVIQNRRSSRRRASRPAWPPLAPAASPRPRRLHAWRSSLSTLRLAIPLPISYWRPGSRGRRPRWLHWRPRR